MSNLKRLSVIPALLAMSVLASCNTAGSGYQPVIDGPVGSNYHIDLQQCQALADSQATVDGKTAGNAALGAAIGAGAKAIFDDSGKDLGRAAIVGALVGGGADIHKKTQRKEAIFHNCMRGRGYNVVG